MALLSYSDASLSKWVKRFNSDRRGGETGSPPPPPPLTSLCSGPLRLHLARRLRPDVFGRASVGGGGGRRVCARGAIKTTAHMREKERDARLRADSRGGREGLVGGKRKTPRISRRGEEDR